MIELLLRRRQMAMSKKEPFVNPYITDGLVLHLDGIEKGSTPDAWTDLINGIVFTKKAGGVTFNSDNVQFGGSSNNALVSSVSGSMPRKNKGTIEVCFRAAAGLTVDKVLFYGDGDSGICFYIRGGGTNVCINCQNSGTDVPNAVFTQSDTVTYSCRLGLAVQNFQGQEFVGGNNYITKKQTVMIVGGSGRGASTIYDCFNGKIHSIRVYNRHLTEEEILHNQAIDNTRFHLGLEL